MSYSILNLEDLTNKLFQPDEDFCSDLICLPNILLMRYASYGNDFRLQYKLNTSAGIEQYAVWWLEHQFSIKYYEKQTLAYFLNNYHQIRDKNDIFRRPTILMELLWKNSLELQRVFPKALIEPSTEYWEWWMNHGAERYNITNRIPIVLEEMNDNDVSQFYIDLIWTRSENLQKMFPDPMEDDKQSFLLWCFENKPLEWKAFENFVSKTTMQDLEKWFYRGENVAEEKVISITDTENFIAEKIKAKKEGIAIIGYPNGVLGLGEEARLLSESCNEMGIKTDLYNANETLTIASVSFPNTYSIAEYKDIYLCNIYCLPPFNMLGMALEYGLQNFTSTINIGLWQWELENFPKESKFAIELLHKITAISKFTANSIEKMFEKPVDVIPETLAEPIFIKKERSYFNLPNKDFLFFYAFDANSYLERKNPLAYIEAFQRAFPLEINVGCVLKVMNSRDSQIWNECKRRAMSDKRIYIIDGVLDRSDVLALIDTCDVIVSLHRSEGFGRLMAEAMLMKKLVIASRYSGNLDYMTDENSYLVSGIKVPVFEGEYPFSDENIWFQPDINEAAEIMKSVLNNKELTQNKIDIAYADIKRKYSKKAVGMVMKKIIGEAID